MVSSPYFTASLQKKSKSLQKLGVTFASGNDDQIIIAKVSSAFQKKTALVAGLTLLKINSEPITSVAQANELVNNVPLNYEVTFTVKAHLVTATKKRKSPFSTSFEGKIGITLWEEPGVGSTLEDLSVPRILITQVDSHGLFPSLQAGDILYAVNGKVVTTFKKTLEMLKQNKSLTLIVLESHPKAENSFQRKTRMEDHPMTNLETQDEIPVQPAVLKQLSLHADETGVSNPILPLDKIDLVRVVACVLRPDTSVTIGLSLEQDQVNECLVITSIDPSGVFAKTGLKTNMKLVKINGHAWNRISEQKLSKATELLAQATGRITLEAVSSHPQSFENQRLERQIISIQKATPSFQLELGLEEVVGKKLQISKASSTCEKVLGLKLGLIVIKVNGVVVGNSAQLAQEEMNAAFPILSLECLNRSPSQEKIERQQVLQKEYASAKQVLPIEVTDKTKGTAKIVRTTVVDLPFGTSKEMGWSLAKHQPLNAIVITDLAPESPFYEKFQVGQVVVSINHVTCPQTSLGANRMLQRELAKNLPGGVRVEAGDVQHVSHTVAGHHDEEDSVAKVMQKAIQRAASELVDFEGDDAHDITELGSVESLRSDDNNMKFDFADGVHLPTTPSQKSPQQPTGWVRNPSPKNQKHTDAASDDAAAACTIQASDLAAAEADEILENPVKKVVESEQISKKATLKETATNKPVEENSNVNKSPEPGSSQDERVPNTITSQQVTPSPKAKAMNNSNDKENEGEDDLFAKLRKPLSPENNREAAQALFMSNSNEVLFPDIGVCGKTGDSVGGSLKSKGGVSIIHSELKPSEMLEREKRVDELQEQLWALKEALKKAEILEAKTSHEHKREIEALREELQATQNVTLHAEERVTKLRSDGEGRLKQLVEAKEEAEKEVNRLKSELESINAHNSKKNAQDALAAEKLRGMLKAVQESCAKAKEEVIRVKTQEETKLQALIDAKSNAERNVFDLKTRLEATELTLKSGEQKLEAITKKHADLKASLASKLKEAEEMLDKKQGLLKAKESELDAVLVSQNLDRQEIKTLKQKLVGVEANLKTAREEYEKEEGGTKLREQQVMTEKIRGEAVELKKQITSLEDSLIFAEDARQTTLKELTALKLASEAQLKTEREVKLESQKLSKHEIEVLKKKLDGAEADLKAAKDEHKLAFEKVNDSSTLREQITSLQASLQVAEGGHRTSLNELSSLKANQVQFMSEKEARLRLEKEIVRLEAEVDKSISGEKKAKQALEKLKQEFKKKQDRLESQERKNRALAEEAREKAEKVVKRVSADISVAEEKRTRAEDLITKTRRTWSFISLLIFFSAFLFVKNESPIRNFVQSFDLNIALFDTTRFTNSDTSNTKRQTKNVAKQADKLKSDEGTRLFKKEQAKIAAEKKEAARVKVEEDARLKKEAAAQAKIQAEQKAKLKAAEKGRSNKENAKAEKIRIKAEKEAAKKAKKEADLLARRKAAEEARSKKKKARAEKLRVKAEKQAAKKAKKEADKLARRQAKEAGRSK